MFGGTRGKFDKRFSDGGQTFAHVPLTFSFRSAPGVLVAIDEVFDHGEHKTGVVMANDVWMPHQALKHQLPGLVELWPPAAAQPGDDPRAWTLPLDLLDAKDPANLVAQRVAQKIAQLIDPGSGEFVHDSRTSAAAAGAAWRHSDPRSYALRIFDAMIRALKRKDIRPLAPTGLNLRNISLSWISWQPGALACFCKTISTLACVLKSPLIGLDDDDLMALAPCRSGSLFDALRASKEAKHIEAVNKLALWRGRAGGGPFAFYASLLGADGGRRDLEARLGPEAGDALDEFLSLAMAHEESAAPSLAAFLNDLAGVEYSIKRDMETGADAVRVMTVHAAKGLEAKIVFLPDTCGARARPRSENIYA
jgi:ATP-dependent helicase/nuclease subunit A